MGDSRTGQKKTKAATEETNKEVPPSKERPTSKAELVGQLIEKIEGKLKEVDLKPTVTDFIRLLQLEKELEEEQPKEIKVSWVDRAEKEHAPEE